MSTLLTMILFTGLFGALVACVMAYPAMCATPMDEGYEDPLSKIADPTEIKTHVEVLQHV
ncbi:MAG TPA: hypothetical protein DEA08_17725 [Planctomycetes bacterium]|nr:hypothetical protein [Planctomycetota bacterium]|tara:strand:- start:38 stop:217 length:180 start_codon:yes stop_codon:yes gene_type:complete